MALSFKAKMRLLLLAGLVLMVATGLMIRFGFKRTEELQTERHLEQLMKEPRTASFGEVPVGLTIGLAGDAAAAENTALFDDGLLVEIVGVEKRPCGDCGPDKEEPMALLHLTGGKIPKGETVVARVSPSSLIWNDRGYLVTMLDIDPTGSVVITVDPRP